MSEEVHIIVKKSETPGMVTVNGDALCDYLEQMLCSLIKGKFSSIHITLNDHASNYVNVADGMDGPVEDDFVSPEERERCIELNKVWRIQWYPDTPVGFCSVQASSLSAALRAALGPKVKEGF